MSASRGAAMSGSRPEPFRETYRQLLHKGFETREAANLTAITFGFRITERPWTVRELNHLIFLRQLRRVGRAWAHVDDRAPGGVRTPMPAVARPWASADGRRSSSAGPAHRGGSGPSNDPVTLLSLLREIAGTHATLDLLRPSATHQRRLDAASGADREGG